jgi:hypothetical protein
VASFERSVAVCRTRISNCNNVHVFRRVF